MIEEASAPASKIAPEAYVALRGCFFLNVLERVVLMTEFFYASDTLFLFITSVVSINSNNPPNNTVN